MLLARVPLINDNIDEGAHAFRLQASRADNTGATGLAIIGDFGTGTIFNDSGAEDRLALKNDDRSIRIDSPIVNEASDYVVFEISGFRNGSNIELILQNQNTGGNHTNLINPSLELWSGNSWQVYNTAITAGTDFLSSQPLFARVNIREEQDTTRESSEDFSLLVNATEGTSIGVATIKDDGTGIKYTGTISTENDNFAANQRTDTLDDDYDRDGIPPTTEEALATLAASQGIAGDIGDMNGDGEQDAEQNALATLAWRTVADFESGNNGTLTDSEAIICMAALTTNGEADDDNLQLENIRVLDFNDADIFGESTRDFVTIDGDEGTRTINLAQGETATTTWDALGFELKPRDGRAQLTDIDPQRDGTQATIFIDTRASNLTQDDVNSFVKFVSQETLEAADLRGQPLEDLDGNPITQEGWYDFTQRRNNNGELMGDGANLIFNSLGQLQGINLTLTDNQFGDNDPISMQISDPGALSYRQDSTEEIPTNSSTEPTLEISGDNQGLIVNGPTGSGLWINLKVTEARDTWQNNFILINSKGKAIGTLGSTPEPHRYPEKGFSGSKHIYLEAGTTLHFQQQSNDFKNNKEPQLKLVQTESNSITIGMEDGRAGTADFNDLIVHATVVTQPEEPRATITAEKQNKTFHGLLDLRWLEAEQQLTLSTHKNNDPNNRIGLVPVSNQKAKEFTVDGVSPSTPEAFRQALRDNLINPDNRIQDDWHISQTYTLSPDQAGLYAPVLITDDDLIFSYGRNSAADGKQHLKVLGENVFGFEDDLAGKRCDWHYDDVIVTTSFD